MGSGPCRPHWLAERAGGTNGLFLPVHPALGPLWPLGHAENRQFVAQLSVARAADLCDGPCG
jgi:hypothetical protein